MATAGQEDIYKERDSSVVSWSEAVYDHICQPCSDEAIREAVGYCADCAEWLCEECFRVHKRSKLSRKHVLRDLGEMKNSTPPIKPSDKCTEKCDQHGGKKLKYYCAGHDIFGCSLCVIQSHKTCKVDHIPDVCESADVKNELQQVTAKLDAVAKESIDTKGEASTIGKQVAVTNAEVVKTYRNYIKKLKQSLDECGTVLDETIEDNVQVETEKMEKVTQTCETVEKECLSMKKRLDDFAIAGQYCNGFVALKQSKHYLKTIESNLKDAKRLLSATTYTFEPNIALEANITGSEGIGTLVEQNLYSKNYRDYSTIQARRVADIPVNSPGHGTCGITGSALLSHDKLILVDNNNKHVKLIDTKANKLISTFNVDGNPWSVCRVNEFSVAVTVQHKPRVLLLSLDASRKMSLVKDIPLNGECWGVATLNDKMAVSYKSPSKLEIMDINGIVLQTITDSRIVHSPQYVAFGADGKSVYVSNVRNDTVTHVNLDGKLIATYEDRELNGPEQIALDSNGMVYVVCFNSNNLHLITPDCKKAKVILSMSDGLKSAYAMSYCDRTNTLYIGMGSCNVIKVYQLS